MSYEVRELETEDFPELLHHIEDSPEKLFIAGKLPNPNHKLLCVVGSRKNSPYGKEVCKKLISGLRGQNVAIVSGLALGTDALAHETALEIELKAIVVPGSGLDPSILYPRTNLRLAQKIIENGGALLSEFEPKFKATPYSFPQRNRIMAGMSHATLIIEAEEKSGTLITARLAMEYNRDVLVVPGNIFSKNSTGSNKLIVDGATPIFSSKDILRALGIEEVEQTKLVFNLNEEEEKIFNLLNEPKTKEKLIAELEMPTTKINILLSSMELRGIIKESYGKIMLVD